MMQSISTSAGMYMYTTLFPGVEIWYGNCANLDPFCNNTSRSSQNMNAKRFNYYTVVLISGKENQERCSWYKNVKTTGSEHNSLAGRKG